MIPDHTFCVVSEENKKGPVNITLILKLDNLAEGVGFEPTLGLLLSLISSQVPSTTQPPFRTNALKTRCAAFLTNILCVRLHREQAHSQRRPAAAPTTAGGWTPVELTCRSL